MLGTILIVILVMALLGVLPRWSHSREWGYAPSGRDRTGAGDRPGATDSGSDLGRLGR